jgi:WD40 repeat protein
MESSPTPRTGLPWPLIIGIVGVLVALGVWRWIQSGKPKPSVATSLPVSASAGPALEAAQTLDADGTINAIVLSRDGQWEAWATSGGLMARRTDGTGRPMRFAPQGISAQASAVCFADGQTLLVIFSDAVYGCSLGNGGTVMAKRFSAKPLCIGATIRGEHVMMVTGLSDGTLEIEPMLVQGGLVLSAGEAKKAQEHKGPVRALAISPDGRHIATTGDDGMMRVIATSDAGYVTSQLIDPGGDNSGTGRCVTYSPDGQFVAAGSARGAAVWSTSNWSARHRLARHDKPVTALAFVDANTLVTGAADGMIFWRLASGQMAGRIEQGHGGLGALAFSFGGETLISAGQDQKVRRWDWKKLIEPQ